MIAGTVGMAFNFSRRARISSRGFKAVVGIVVAGIDLLEAFDIPVSRLTDEFLVHTGTNYFEADCVRTSGPTELVSGISAIGGAFLGAARTTISTRRLSALPCTVSLDASG